MFYVLLFVLLFIIIIAIALRNSEASSTFSASGSRGNKRSSVNPLVYDASKLPFNLGLLPSVPLEDSVRRLEASLPPEFVERLQARVTKTANMPDDEFACVFYELKRFFLMNLILKRAPMFSEKADDVWHEMLMFTREYQRFGESFCGSAIHHAPESEPKQLPGERAWFDWIYAHLFEMTPFSSAIWNGFFRYPLDKETLELMNHGSKEELAELRFHSERAKRYPEVQDTIDRLIQQAYEEAKYAASRSGFENSGRSRQNGSMDMTFLAGAMLFYSMNDTSSFESSMEQHLPEDELASRKDSSACSSSACAGSDGSGGGGDSSGGGSSCSSGSSCGSGCGSS